MSKNAVIVISIGRDYLLQYCLPTVENYCDKYDLSLEVISKPKYNYGRYDEYNYVIFEKNQVYDFYNKYDRILRLDSDIIIRKNCDNIFERYPKECVCVVREDIGSKLKNRRSIIKKIRENLGDVANWNDFYFNSGVVLAGKNNRHIYDISGWTLHDLREKYLSFAKEQTLLNWMTRASGACIAEMEPYYNYLNYFDELYDRQKAKIVHFAGEKANKQCNMLNEYLDWKKS